MDTIAAVSGQTDTMYDAYVRSTQASFEHLVSEHGQLFTTDAKGLWEAYLANIPESHRQHYDCRACESFIKHYGHLVVIDPLGQQHSAMWEDSDAPIELMPAIRALRKIVKTAKVDGVFVTREEIWGTPVAGNWSHLAIKPPSAVLHARRDLTAHQLAAQFTQDYKTLNLALKEFSPPLLEQADTIFQANAVHFAERFHGLVKWLRQRQDDRKKPSPIGRNLLWVAAAKAPAGWCSPRDSAVGSLLKDLASGRSFEQVKARFDKKVNPKTYQRPQAPPSTGNIKQAEDLIAKLDLERALHRRYATPDDLRLTWTPQPVETQEATATGVFGHLTPKGATPVTPLNLPPQTMTWVKFQAEVLPTAEQIELLVPAFGNFSALVTATHADAPPILSWDRPEQRNPVSWFIYDENSLGAYAKHWSLVAGQYVPVVGLCEQPNTWYGRFQYEGNALFFLLQGAHEVEPKQSLSLFPQILRSELHGIRETIEAYSNSRAMGVPAANQLACGLRAQKGLSWGITLRVTSQGRQLSYKLDRWD